MWAQDTFWGLLNIQQCLGIVTTRSKKGIQVNLDKPKGGFRPLAMLEESLKAIGGPVVWRRVLARCICENGTTYGARNLAGEAGRHAAPEALYADTFVCEDALRHDLPMCRIPSDYEKLYNTVQRTVADTVDSCEGSLTMFDASVSKPGGAYLLQSYCIEGCLKGWSLALSWLSLARSRSLASPKFTACASN